SMLDSIREGLAYIRQDVVVRWIIVLAATTALFARPYIQLLPAVAHDLLKVGAVELSWMLAASGVGSLAGALATAALGGLQRRGAVLIGASIVFGALLVAFTEQRARLPTLPLLVLLGFSTMVFLGMANGLLQTRAPDHLRGRVMSVYTMVFMGLMPLGSMVMGSIGSVVGTGGGLLVGGVGCTIVALYAAARITPLHARRAHLLHRRVDRRGARAEPGRAGRVPAPAGDRRGVRRPEQPRSSPRPLRRRARRDVLRHFRRDDEHRRGRRSAPRRALV